MFTVKRKAIKKLLLKLPYYRLVPDGEHELMTSLPTLTPCIGSYFCYFLGYFIDVESMITKKL